jgi:hypothetical protein
MTLDPDAPSWQPIALAVATIAVLVTFAIGGCVDLDDSRTNAPVEAVAE